MTRPRRRPLPLWAAIILNLAVGLTVVGLVQAFVVKIGRIPSGSMEQTLQSQQWGGDRILVNRLAYVGGAAPHPSDIVAVVRPPGWPGALQPAANPLSALVRGFGDLTGLGPSNEDYIVKRVAAVGGQRISCCDVQGRLLLDGKPIDEPYVYQDLPFEPGRLDCTTAPRSPRCFPETLVPAGQLVLLGDHRSNSEDSAAECRYAGSTGSNPAGSGAPAACVRTAAASAVVGQVIFRVWPLDRIGVPR